MDYSRILKRAFEITKKYPVLWFFGFFASAAWGGNFNARFPTGNMRWGRGEGILKGLEHGYGTLSHMLTLEAILAIAMLVLLFSLIYLVLRYVSLTALPRLVDEIESGRDRISFSHGWKLGWSRRAWAVFGIEIVSFFVAVAVLVFVGGVLIALPLYFFIKHGHSSTVGILLKMLPFGLSALIILFVALIVISLVTQFAQYHAAIEGEGVFQSFGWSIQAFKKRWSSIAMMWLIMVGVGILLGLIVLIGILVFGLVTLAIAGGIGWVLWKTVSEVLGVIVGILVGLVTFVLPMFAVAAVVSTYKTTVWVLVYRELKEERSPADLEPA